MNRLAKKILEPSNDSNELEFTLDLLSEESFGLIDHLLMNSLYDEDFGFAVQYVIYEKNQV